jgi:hypothetical protein
LRPTVTASATAAPFGAAEAVETVTGIGCGFLQAVMTR